MPSIQDEAVVLNCLPTGESAIVVRLLALTRGRRNAIAPGGKKSIKRFAGALQPFCQIQAMFSVNRNKSLDMLQNAEQLDSFYELKESLGKLYLASYYCELVDAMLVEGETYPEIYHMLLFFLRRLKENEPSLKHRIFFEIRLLSLLGNQPDFTRLDNGNSDDQAWFDPQRERFIDSEKELGFSLAGKRTLSKDAIPVDKKIIDVLEAAAELPLHSLKQLKLNRQQAKTAAKISRALVLVNVPRKIKSMQMLDEELGQ